MSILIRFLVVIVVFDNCIRPLYSLNCSSFLHNYQDRVPNVHNLTVPVAGSASNAGDSSVCRLSATCCNVDLENQLRNLSKMDYEKILKDALGTLSKMLKTKSVQFNDFFKELLTKSKKDFHDMFKRTYGILYEENAYIFANFFSELESYYMNGKTNLADVMDNFFTILYQKMYTVIHRQYKFDEKYLICISEHMSELKPFGDVPQKLALPLKRSFVATRAYAQSLSKAGDVVSNLIYLPATEQCAEAVMRMIHCSSCAGAAKANICTDYCTNVMKGCLSDHTELDTSWVKFIEAMSDLERRLTGSFNIELVVDPMSVKISEGIMNFQENSVQVSEKLLKGCGTPPFQPARRRREINSGDDDASDSADSPVAPVTRFDDSYDDNDDDNDDDDDDDDDEDVEEEEEEGKNEKKSPAILNTKRADSKTAQRTAGSASGGSGLSKSDSRNGNSNGNGNNKNRGKKQRADYNLVEYSSSPVHGFFKLTKEIGAEISATKNFWKKLPSLICTERLPVESNRNSTNCWNGTTVASYTLGSVSDGKKYQQWNPEVPVNVKKKSSLLNEQVFTLKMITSHLRNAYNGMDVYWTDTDDQEENVSSGSGDSAGTDQDAVGRSGDKDSDSDYDDEDGNAEVGSGDRPILKISPPEVNNGNWTIVPVLYTPMPDFAGTASTTAATVTVSTSSTNNRSLSPSSGNEQITRSTAASPPAAANNSHPSIVSNGSKDFNSFENPVRKVSADVGTSTVPTTTGGSPSSNTINQMSLARAIASYLLPAVVMWIGGSFNDWFNSLVVL